MMTENCGTYMTTNALLDLVKYENVIRFDTDDVMEPIMIEEIAKFKSEDDDIIRLGFSDWVDGQVSNYHSANDGIIYFKKRVMDEIAGGYQPWLCAADSELLTRLKDRVNIKDLNERLFLRRVHDNSLSERKDTGVNSILRRNYQRQIKTHYSESEVKIERVSNELKCLSYEKSYNLLFMISTYNRLNFLKETINSWYLTCDKKHNWTLIISDDGSDDGTKEYLYNLKFDNIKIILIENERRGIHYQINRMLKIAGNLEFDFGFKSDDDVIFLKSNWDNRYIGSAKLTGYYHLVFYDKKWNEKKTKKNSIKKYLLENSVEASEVQGALWTFTKEVIDNVGFLDTKFFNLCGLGHVDYTMRCSRLGYNNFEHPFDIINSNSYISLIKEKYVSNNNYDSIWNTPKQIAEKTSILYNHRTFIGYNEQHVNILGQPIIQQQSISFCIPAYKAEDYIEECLDSIEAQRCHKEILVGVDGCEKTLEVLKRIRTKYSNIRIFWFSENVGTSIIKNTLVKYAKHNIISFFDSDDIMESHYADYIVENISPTSIVRFRFKNFEHNDLTRKLSNQDYCANGAMSILKKSFLDLNGFWIHRVSEDADFIARWKVKYDDIQLKIYGFKRRIHTHDISYNQQTGCYGENVKFLEEQIAKRLKMGIIKNDILLSANCQEIDANINNYFNQIYCLNLDRREDKWKIVKEKFDTLGINVCRFSAVDGNHINEDILKKHPKLNKYEVGCMLSHYNIVMDAKKNAYKRILIFEDDVLFVDDFLNKFTKKVAKIPNWKIFYLGATQWTWGDVKFIEDFYYANKTDGTFAYAIDEIMYDELIQTEEIVNRPIDNKLFDIQKKYDGECFVSFPNLVIADVSDSEIRESRDNNIYKIKMKWNEYRYE